jgi:hypothetical protein
MGRANAKGGAMRLDIPVSAGELLDKITILRLKRARLRDPAQISNVLYELTLLEDAARVLPDLGPLVSELAAVNAQLWAVEDALRAAEAAGEFGAEFITQARAVYQWNDRRAALKREINLKTGSDLIEEKDYSGAP